MLEARNDERSEDLGIDNDFEEGGNRDDEILTQREAENEILIRALGRGRRQEIAGELAGISARTVRRRIREDQLGPRIREERVQWVRETAGELTADMPDAIRIIKELARDENTPASVRLRAAEFLAKFPGRFRDEELEERLTFIENAAEQATKALRENPWM